ncbi:MAG: CBS and ACT domain-containing protein [Bacteroidota bacterium]
MQIRDIMSQPVRSIGPDVPLSEAYREMHESDLRHFPVVEEDRLVGVITDRDLRYATSRLHPHPLDPGTAVREVMASHPVTAAPLDPVEEAARLMRGRKIGCLPVVENGQLVGIVTGMDLLDALVRLTGLEKPSSRLEVVVKDKSGTLADLTALIASSGFNIRSMLTYPQHGDDLHVIMRIDTIHPHHLVETLSERGIEVLWPRKKQWSR